MNMKEDIMSIHHVVFKLSSKLTGVELLLRTLKETK